ncbi:terpenoid synthase [Trichoderma reesei RUT C-30]|uniref:Terpene synthase n=1 Tax=Hypocrea jecorina (strain ATCC 56765 / BCRC 32924 / NRRL 11460 / Rut C-30) TaxID=1344414 RepID=A0A024S349_HYPJR|nr:terpenoid synthase [Trichoderma reesei RUT C-30]
MSTLTVLEPTLRLDAPTVKLQSPKQADRQLQVVIPDLFSSIMAVEPTINPHYKDVKAEADAWFKSLLQLKGKAEATFNKTDFGFAAAVWAPSADKDRFRTAVDWANWIFYFDDPAAQAEIDSILAILDDKPTLAQTDKPLIYAFQSIWDRIKALTTASQGATPDAHKKYVEGLIYQTQRTKLGSAASASVDEYMSYRRETIGVILAIRLVEYAENIKLSQAQMDHPALQLCTRTIVDLVILSNDILSYKKEVELNDAGNNLVTILKAQNLSDQEAMDKIGRMLDACYESWYNAMDELPVWGAGIDQEVRRYLVVCRNVGLGNLHWSFRSGRYFGTSGEEVRKTRILTLPSA